MLTFPLKPSNLALLYGNLASGSYFVHPANVNYRSINIGTSMEQEDKRLGPYRAIGHIAFRAAFRAAIMSWTASLFMHLEGHWFFPMFLIFFALGLGRFEILSTRPVSVEKNIQFRYMLRDYQLYMSRHPNARPKGDFIQWVSMGTYAMAASLFWAWIVILITHGIFSMLGESGDYQPTVAWLVISVIDWISRMLRFASQGQLQLYGKNYDEAFEAIDKVVQRIRTDSMSEDR